VPSNIAEGHGRLTDLQFRHFLGNARGSLYELQTQVELSYDLGYICVEKLKDFMGKSSEGARLVNGLITALRDLREPAKKNITPLTAQSAANSASSAMKERYS